VSQPSRTAACAFTALTAVAGLELAVTALWMPWRRLVLALAVLAQTAAICAAVEWTALRTRPPADRNTR
jgi:hypothetical protein